MAGGGYRGGSTIIYTGNPKMDIQSRKSKQKKKKPEDAPGMHVSSPRDRKKIMKRVWDSRRRSKALAAEKEAQAKASKRAAFAKFVADVKKLESE